jgi:hypothetical protein
MAILIDRINRVELRDVIEAGVIAGVIFAAFESIATAVVSGPASATMPIRMISAIVLGKAALDSSYSFVPVAITGLAVHLLLSIAFAGLFAAMATRVAHATEGELLTNSGQLAVAGTIFGATLWLVNFYLVAPLVGWTWFPGNVHRVIALVGHAFFFGFPLGWSLGRMTGVLTMTVR